MKKKTQKHPGGRPTKYNPSFCQQIISFFSKKPYARVYKGGKYHEVVNDLPTFSKFAHSVGVNKDSIVEWAKVYPEFSVAYKTAKELQEDFLMTNGLRGNFSQPFAIFTAKNICGWKDSQQFEHSGKDGGPIPVASLDLKGLASEDLKALVELARTAANGK